MVIKTSNLSSFNLFLSFVTISPTAEKAFFGSTDEDMITSQAWYSFSRLSGIFFVASKNFISFFKVLIESSLLME